LRICLADPSPTDLHRHDDVKRLIERPLIISFCGDAWIAQGFFSVDGEDNLVCIPFDSVGIKFITLDGGGL